MPDLTAISGDTLKLRVHAYQDSTRKVAYNLTGKQVEFHAVDKLVNPTIVIDKSMGSGIVAVSPSIGEVEVTLGTGETNFRGVLLYTLRVIDGVDEYTAASGKITFQPSH